MGKTYKKISKKKKNQRIIDIFEKKIHLKNQISPFLKKSRNTIFTINYSDQNYKQYFYNSFNVNCIKLIVNYTNTFDYIDIKNFKSKLIDLVKYLMMDEMEIVILSLIIDNYGLNNYEYKIDEYLLFLGLFTKKLSNNNLDFIFKIINETKPYFILDYIIWENNIIPFIPNIILINERYQELNKFNSNVKLQKKILDYNSIVQQIELPNNDHSEKTENNNVKETNLIDELLSKKKKNDNGNKYINPQNLNVNNLYFHNQISLFDYNNNNNFLVNFNNYNDNQNIIYNINEENDNLFLFNDNRNNNLTNQYFFVPNISSIFNNNNFY